jgi:hypothetical protein
MRAMLLAALRAASPWPAVLARGGDPPEPPGRAMLLAALPAASPWPAVLARGGDPPEPPGGPRAP